MTRARDAAFLAICVGVLAAAYAITGAREVRDRTWRHA